MMMGCLAGFSSRSAWWNEYEIYRGPQVASQCHLEVGAAGRQDHLVGLGALTVTGNGHIRERLLVPEVLEAGHHVGLEVVPSEAELLLVVHRWAGQLV